MGTSNCAARLRDGTRCDHVARHDPDFCNQHAKLAKKYGPETVMRGEQPKEKLQVVIGGSGDDDLAEPELEPETRTEPSMVRSGLADAAAEEFYKIKRSLLDAATGASKEQFVTISCPGCNKTTRMPIQLPDVRARIAAVEVLLREGLGRAPQSPEISTPTLPDTAEKMRRLGWEEMEVLAARMHLDSLELALNEGAEKSLANAVEKLSPEQRELLLRSLS
jgi:hypothetical protein